MHRMFSGIVAALVLSGCGLVPDRSDRYQYEERLGSLRVPDFYDRARLGERYPVGRAEQAFVPVDNFTVPAPPSPGGELFLDQFALKASGSDQWLLITEPVGKIWPALIDYWRDAGAVIDRPDSTQGVVSVRLDPNSLKARKLAETLEVPIDSLGTLQARIGPGLRRNTSEVRMRVEADGQPVQGESAIITRLLTDLQNFLLAHRDALESYSLAAQGLGVGSRIQLVTPEDADQAPYLDVDLAFERAWTSVGQALEEGRVRLVDRNRSSGEYFVNYAQDPDDLEPGFWSGLFGGGEDDRLSDRFNYRVLVQQDGSKSRVTVLPEAGQARQSAESLSLLNRILENLS